MPERIALLIHALHGGGAERLMSELAERWASKSEVHLITWAKADTDRYPIPSSVTRHGLDLMQPSSNPLSGIVANLRRVRTLRRKLTEIAPDFLLSFSDQMNIVAMEASRQLKIPRWISEHSDPTKQKLSRFWELWRQRSYPTCSGCVVLTDAIAGTMSSLVPRKRIQVIPPSLRDIPDENRYLRASSEREQADTKRILFVGRLSHEKNVGLLLEAWALAKPKLQNWKLTIVGDGPERKQLEAQAANLDDVEFHGWVQDPTACYDSSSLFALTSRYEGFPVALLEAMSHGLPCVSTDCSTAFPTINKHEETVATVPTGDASAFANALTTLANDSERSKAMSARAYATSKEYSWSRVGEQWDAILEIRS